MGRFSAPQVHNDRDDDGGAVPMDWEVVPDPNEDDSEADLNDGDVAPPHPAAAASSGGPCSDVAQQHASMSEYYQNNAAERNELLLRAAENYLANSTHRWEREEMQARRRARIRWVLVVAVALVAIVLKRHAPPPPPLSSLSVASLSANFGGQKVAGAEGFSTGASASGEDVVHHETWASYSRHLVGILHRSLAYGTSVAWYAVSNAFCYTWEEVRDGLDAFTSRTNRWAELQKRMDVRSLWICVRRKMTTVAHWCQMQMRGKRHRSQDMGDIEIAHPKHRKVLIDACPIRIPAVSNRHAQLSPDTKGWATEDFLRQTIGASLSPQNLAIKLIAEGLDAWGESLVKAAPEALVHKMAAAVSNHPTNRFLDEETLAEWILPPAAGFLLVGSGGVGKRHTARRLAWVLLGHCDSPDESAKRTGVLEVNAENYGPNNKHQLHRATTLVVDHIGSRQDRGSVVIIHHIESLPPDLLSEISDVLSGNTDTLSYGAGDNLVEASCNGTVFVLTSKKWGSNHILDHIQRNGGQMNRLHRGMESDSLLSSIRAELESPYYLDFGGKLAKHAITAPFLPFQQEDLASILQGRIHALNLEHQGDCWKRLEVSHAAAKHSVGMDHVEYDALYSEEDVDEALLTFATGGARSLHNNALWETLRAGYATEEAQRRPGHSLKVRLDDSSKETVFSWCGVDNEGVETCEEELRSLLG